MKERAYPVYTVNKHAEGLLVGGHPWVYENDIQSSPEAEPENGTLVDVVSTKGAYLGTGFLSLKSKIRVRLISRNANDTFDAAFWKRRVEYAWAYRKTVLEPADLTACRVIFGEADQFPGLTVDRFNNILVTQTLSVGMEKLKLILFPLLAEVLRADGQTIEGIYERNDEALRAKEGLAQNKGWFDLPGETHPDSTQTEICENGVFYHVDFENGQKTGFFLDQKYNRRAVARIAAGHTVLDCFTHTGSFALNAAKGGAARVTAADISAEAIAMAQRNAQRNNLTNMDFLCEDTFELLPRLEKEGHPYDFIILDPPAFTKARRTVENAMRGYKEINYRAMKLLPRGGYLHGQLLSLCHRGAVHQDAARRRKGCPPAAAADRGEAAGTGSPHPVGRARDQLPEVLPVPGDLKVIPNTISPKKTRTCLCRIVSFVNCLLSRSGI